jgi:hypothetical protein
MSCRELSPSSGFDGAGGSLMPNSLSRLIFRAASARGTMLLRASSGQVRSSLAQVALDLALAAPSVARIAPTSPAVSGANNHVVQFKHIGLTRRRLARHATARTWSTRKRAPGAPLWHAIWQRQPMGTVKCQVRRRTRVTLPVLMASCVTHPGNWSAAPSSSSRGNVRSCSFA